MFNWLRQHFGWIKVRKMRAVAKQRVGKLQIHFVILHEKIQATNSTELEELVLQYEQVEKAIRENLSFIEIIRRID
jgi:hypothetical protein